MERLYDGKRKLNIHNIAARIDRGGIVDHSKVFRYTFNSRKAIWDQVNLLCTNGRTSRNTIFHSVIHWMADILESPDLAKELRHRISFGHFGHKGTSTNRIIMVTHQEMAILALAAVIFNQSKVAVLEGFILEWGAEVDWLRGNPIRKSRKQKGEPPPSFSLPDLAENAQRYRGNTKKPTMGLH